MSVIPTVSADGVGVVSAGQLNAYEISCYNVGVLRTVVGQTGMSVFLQGTNTPNDGGQGNFYWDYTSTATDNNFSVIRPYGVIYGAWLRTVISATIVGGDVSNATAIATGTTTARTIANLFGDYISVKDFGAVGDGVIDDTTAIQSAINSLSNGGNIIIPAGNYKITSTINIVNSNTVLVGQGGIGFELSLDNGATSFTWAGGNSPMISIAGLPAGALSNSIGIYNLSLLDNGVASYGIYCAQSQNFVFENIFTRNLKTAGIYFTSTASQVSPTGLGGRVVNHKGYQKFSGGSGNSLWLNCLLGPQGTMVEFTNCTYIQDTSNPSVMMSSMDGVIFTHLKTFAPSPSNVSVYIDNAPGTAQAAEFIYPIINTMYVAYEALAEVAAYQIIGKNIGDNAPAVVGPGRKSVASIYQDGRSFGRQAFDVSHSRFADGFFGVNASGGILTTRDGNWNITGTAAISAGGNAFGGGGIKVGSGTTFGGITAGSFSLQTQYSGYLKKQEPDFYMCLQPDSVGTGSSYDFGFFDSASASPSNGIWFNIPASGTITSGTLNCKAAISGVVSTLTVSGFNFNTYSQYMISIDEDENLAYFYYRESQFLTPVNKLWIKIGSMSIFALNNGLIPCFFATSNNGNNYNANLYHIDVSALADSDSYPYP